MAYDKMNKFFSKCCKKKVAKKDNIQINKEEMEKLKEKEKEKELEKEKKQNKEEKVEEIKEKKE